MSSEYCFKDILSEESHIFGIKMTSVTHFLLAQSVNGLCNYSQCPNNLLYFLKNMH